MDECGSVFSCVWAWMSGYNLLLLPCAEMLRCPCLQAGAKVVSMSLGGGYSFAYEDMAARIRDAGALLVVAAGNSECRGSNSSQLLHNTVPSCSPLCAGQSQLGCLRPCLGKHACC